MSLAVAQSTSGSGSGTGLTTSKSLSSTPTAGNLLIAFIGTGNGTNQSTITWDTTKWTPFERAINPNDTDQVITALYRYVQGGDTTSMPAFATAGSAFFSYTVQEISGVNGTWANDYQSSRYVQAKNVTTLTTPTDVTRSANCLGILGFFKYNRSANSGLDGAWTSDQNTNNSGNYGSFGCAHQAVASIDTTISATNTFQAGNDTTGMIQVIIQTAASTVPYVVRYRYKDSTASGFPGTVQFGGAPLSGHSLVAFLAWQDGSATDPTIGGSWTQWESVTQGANHQLFGLKRDVSGDTDVLAAIASAGSAFWALYVVEVGGMTGVFNTDKLADQKGAESSAATVTTTGRTTSGNNKMILTAFFEYNTSTLVTNTGTDYLVAPNIANSADYGAAPLGFTFKATAGAYSSVWTKGNSAHKTAYIELEMGAGAASLTGTATMAFGGISFNASGGAGAAGSSAMHFAGIAMAGAGNVTNYGSAVMAFAGLSFVASGNVKHTGVGAMHFAGISIVSNGFDLGPSPTPIVPGAHARGVAQKNLEPLQWNVSIVDPKTGFPSPELQLKWRRNFDIINDQAKVNAQIVSKSYIDTHDATTLAAAAVFATGQAAAAQAAAIAAADAYTDVMSPRGMLTVATLPASPQVNTRAVVSDSTVTLAAGLGNAVVGSGGNIVPVFWNGAAWIIG